MAEYKNQCLKIDSKFSFRLYKCVCMLRVGSKNIPLPVFGACSIVCHNSNNGSTKLKKIHLKFQTIAAGNINYNLIAKQITSQRRTILYIVLHCKCNIMESDSYSYLYRYKLKICQNFKLTGPNLNKLTLLRLLISQQ